MPKCARGEIVQAVRSLAAVSSTGTVTKKQVRITLGYSVDQVAAAFSTLVGEGWLKKIRHGVYQYINRPESIRPSEVNDRIWRAMRIESRWSAADIARRSGSTTSYIYKRMRMYRANGLIERMGQRDLPGGGTEKMWRVTKKGREAVDGPMRVEFVPDPLVMAAVELNRLVCSRLAWATEAGRVEALGLCAKVQCGLEGLRVED